MGSLINDRNKHLDPQDSENKDVVNIEEFIKVNKALKSKNKLLAEKLALQKLEVDKLKNAESQYKKLLDRVESFIIVDNEFRIDEISENALSLQDQISTGNNFLKYFRLKDEKAFFNHFSLALQGQVIGKKFAATTTMNKEKKDYILSIESFKPGFQVAITFKKLSEAKNFDITKLSWLATKTKNGVLITDGQGNIEWVNEGYSNITGFLFEECLGEKPVYLESNEQYGQYDKRIVQHLNQGKRFTGETISYKKSGDPYWTNLEVNPIFDADENLTNLVIIETDISENKETEEKLLQSAQRSINILESITDAMFIIDVDRNFTYLNKQAEILLNQKKEDLLGKNIWDEFTFAGSNIIREKITEALNKKSDIHFEEFIEPAEQWFEFHGYVSSEGLSVYLRSIQSRKVSEEKLKDKNEELIKINNELDSFVYRAAHDLRAPLASVLGLINISRIEEDAEKKNDYLNNMTECINKLDSFINKIIHYSRNSRLVVYYEEIDFEALFDDIFSHLELFKGADRIKKELEFKNQIPFYSDKARISDAIQNILVNAVQYQKTYIEQPVINIKIETNYLMAKITIEDNGNGIHEDHIDKVTQMFYRASEQSTGSGLGLYITTEIVKKLGGTINISSQLKIGSTFVIEIPNGQ